jgi:hypothetical protein
VFDDSSPANQEKYFELLERTRTHNDRLLALAAENSVAIVQR